MLFLLFELGSDRYAVEAGRIAEVLPLLEVQRIPHSPKGVSGAINYHGVPVPVVDLSELAIGEPTALRFSTRIVLVRLAEGPGAQRLLGLIAERATETLRCDGSEFVPSGVTSQEAPYLGPVRPDPRGLIQWVDPVKLLPPAVTASLYAALVER